MPYRERILASLFQMHKDALGYQVLSALRSGPLLPYRPEFLDSTRAFWKRYERTLTPVELRAWRETLRTRTTLPVRSSEGRAGRHFDRRGERVAMLKITGITARTTLLAWTVTLATLGIFVVIIIPEQKRDLRIGLESQATGVAGALQGEVAGAAVSEDFSSVVDHALQVMAGDKTVDFLVITKNDGYAVVVERDSWRVIPNIDGFWHPIVRTPTGNIERLPLFEKRVFHFAVPFDYSGLQWGWIHVGLSLESYDRSVRQVYLRTGVLAVVCILLSLVASRFYAKRFVEPILRLRAVVEQVARGDLTARAHIDSQDEIEQLADAFNNMADAVLHRNRIVESVRLAAQSLQGATQWSEVIDQILSKIGQSANASRVLVGESHLSPENVALGSIRFEWTAPGIPGWRDSFQNRDLAKRASRNWRIVWLWER